MSALKEKYRNEIVPKLQEKHGYANPMQIPRITKVVVSSGVGTQKPREAMDETMRTLAAITGQKPAPRKAKISVAGFKLREGQTVGCSLTLRGDRMYDFLYRLINVALPRVRDFRGVNPKSFDGFGNYSMGLSEQSIFTEVDLDKMKNTIGMNITIVTTAGSNEEAYDMLTLFGMPFAK
jgi:large subunit ribosomal protein L5